MKTGLESRVAIVTGGAKGIGEAVVRTLVDEGARVLFADIDAEAGTALEAELREKNADVHFLKVDLTEDGAGQRVVDETLLRLGSVSILVNNMGRNNHVGLGATADEFRRSLNLNLVPSFELVKAAAPHLPTSGGRIVMIGSKVAETGQGGTSGYAASKGALSGLTREWAVELAPQGVTVNTVVPAEVWTPLYRSELDRTPDPAATKARVESAIPLGNRFTTAQEIANMVVFLASDLASHTTGQLIHVDGGYTHLDRMATHP